jgi:molybdenum cofactor cytidylyltransferase
MTKLGLVVLAAGLSCRLEGPNKLLLPWRGKPLVEHVLTIAQEINADRKVLVLNRDEADIRDLLPHPAGWQYMHNHDGGSGLSSSLRLGLSSLQGCAAALVMLGDMPDIDTATIQQLLRADTGQAYAVVPTYQGQWGHPVLLSAQAMSDCKELVGAQGARGLLKAHFGDVLCLEVDDPGVLRDFDVATDFGPTL